MVDVGTQLGPYRVTEALAEDRWRGTGPAGAGAILQKIPEDRIVLHHPGVAPSERLETPQGPFLVRPENGEITAADILETGAAFGPRLAVHIVLEILSVLSYFEHELGGRGPLLRAENVLLTAEGQVLLADFRLVPGHLAAQAAQLLLALLRGRHGDLPAEDVESPGLAQVIEQALRTTGAPGSCLSFSRALTRVYYGELRGSDDGSQALGEMVRSERASVDRTLAFEPPADMLADGPTLRHHTTEEEVPMEPTQAMQLDHLRTARIEIGPAQTPISREISFAPNAPITAPRLPAGTKVPRPPALTVTNQFEEAVGLVQLLKRHPILWGALFMAFSSGFLLAGVLMLLMLR